MNSTRSVVSNKGPGIRQFFFYSVLSVAVMLSLDSIRVNAQGRPVLVSYDVEFSTTGALVSRLGQCHLLGLSPGNKVTGNSNLGFDKLSGTIMGYEPAPKDDDLVYEGKLTRESDITFCYVATDQSGDSRACEVTVRGRAEAWFSLVLEFGGRGGYLQLLDDKPVKVMSSSVTGTCDPAEMAEWQRDYKSMLTAGSPNGQHVNVVAMPRIGPFPKKFDPLPLTTQSGPPDRSPGPSAGDAGIWALTVRGRQP